MIYIIKKKKVYIGYINHDDMIFSSLWIAWLAVDGQSAYGFVSFSYHAGGHCFLLLLYFTVQVSNFL